jgi:hypothetical protein
MKAASHGPAGLAAIMVLARFAHPKSTDQTGKFIKNRLTET